MDIKKAYYTKTKEEFDQYLNNLINSEDTIHFFLDSDNPFRYNRSAEACFNILRLYRAIWEFDSLISSFNDFDKKQIIQSFLIDEIESTNKIENIESTRHNIYTLINKLSDNDEYKIKSIANSYSLLLNNKCSDISSLQDVRNIYDSLLDGSIDENNKPDGEYFRKEKVFINDGIKDIHQGMYPEAKINSSMEELVHFYNDSQFDIVERMIISHFLIETIHPFYDGNGRLGRFMFSLGLYNATKSLSSFVISKAFSDNKSKYYHSFKIGRDIHEFGFINSYATEIIEILIEHLDKVINALKEKKNVLDSLIIKKGLSKLERKIFLFIYESTLFTNFGVNSIEIMENTSSSKRTLIYALNQFKEQDLLTETKIGKFTYYKMNIDKK